ncbi:MAG: ATP phosphoribosyltransferase regulatory subunit, partial [Microgenomates group bacterium]
MSNTAPQTLKGFRDFLPKEKRARDFVASKLKLVFERFGFDPLETPTLEYASLLTGKYGTEADTLLYTFTDSGGREVGLRYDQT